MNDMKQRDDTTKRPTPETDEACKPRNGETKALWIKRMQCTCKKLERERDEAREIALNLQNIMGMKI
jgi:hypothetical protein